MRASASTRGVLIGFRNAAPEAEQREAQGDFGAWGAYAAKTLIFGFVMRPAAVLTLLLVSGCSSGGPPDPAIYARPNATAKAGSSGEVPVPPPPACGDFCGKTFLPEVQTFPNLYFLVDRSGSMSEMVDGTTLSKYDMARKVLGKLLTVIGHRVRYGASIFPLDTEGCGPGHEIFPPTVGGLPACDGTLDPVLVQFLTSFGDFAPNGATPTAAAISGLSSELEGLDGATYLVLITDGAPNCNVDATCDADGCTLNIEGASLGRAQCTPSFNCCDPANAGPDAGGNCVDGDATEHEVARLASHGIPTYVVGMPGAAPYASVLNRLAVAGGTARTEDTSYYAVNDESELETALYAIGTGVAISCTIDLDAPPDDPSRVNVYFDGEVVPADPDNGWSWDGDTRIQVNGDACARLESGDVIDARAVFGCDTVVR
jgi:hypothetical protein